ncbi:MAG: prolyl-tRNA synthetase associated domain-containing 1-like [Trebouxia sp. A1-2]|nr:MAG: prolyl-tRNA synthetase associated domain-containing 1-like [Trebouxia sp. A1-2]
MLAALGIRLGVPKPGVRMAPSELLESVLGVPLGSVTPLAVVQPTAASIVLLLDQKLKGQDRILVHPLTNDKTVAISSDGLEAFLRSLQREAHYVDLEAQPAAGAGQADLRHILPDSNIETAEKQADAKAKEAKQPAKAESVSPSLSMQDLAASIVHQVLQGAGIDAETLLPETIKKLSDAVFLQLNSLQNTACSNGYKAAKHEVAEYCMKTFGS